MNRLALACSVALALGAGACDAGEPLQAEAVTVDASPAPASAADAGVDTTPPGDPCAIPDGDTVLITSCPNVCKVCVSQNYDYRYVPPADAPGVHKINLAGCTLAGRSDIICVSDCDSPCPN